MKKFYILVILNSIIQLGYSQCYEATENLILKSRVLENYFTKNQTFESYINDTLIRVRKLSERNLFKIELIFSKDSLNRQELICSLKSINGTNEYNFVEYNNYFNGKLSGVIKRVSENSITITHYEKGLRNGKELKYSIAGDTIIKEIANFRKGKINGEILLFDNGKLISSINYKNDNPNGECTFFFTNGNIRSEGMVKGYFIYRRKQSHEDFQWYFKGKRPLHLQLLIDTFSNIARIEKVPDYLPSDLFQIKSGIIYPRRIGEWKNYDECGILLNKKKYIAKWW